MTRLTGGKQADGTDHPLLGGVCLRRVSCMWRPSLSPKKLKLLHVQEYCESTGQSLKSKDPNRAVRQS